MENLCKIILPETLKGAAKKKNEDGTQEEENNTPAQSEQDNGKAKECLNKVIKLNQQVLRAITLYSILFYVIFNLF